MEKEIKYCNHEGTEEDPCECEVIEKEFNLSEKIVEGINLEGSRVIYWNDIKEFIKKLELENVDLMKDVLDLIEIHKGTKVNLKSKLVLLLAAHLGEREKLAGKKLT